MTKAWHQKVEGNRASSTNLIPGKTADKLKASIFTYLEGWAIARLVTIEQSRAELEVCFIHLALGVTLFGLILVKNADIEGQKNNNKNTKRLFHGLP